MGECTGGFRHSIRVRYGEVDPQGVVLNAHYRGLDGRRTSRDLDYVGSREGRPVFTARVVYVRVAMGSETAIGTPRSVREHLGEAIDPIGSAASESS